MARRERLVETRPSGVGRARGLVSSRTSGRRVGARTYAPPDALVDIVATLWTGSWDLRGQAPHTTERVPDPCCNIVFEVGNMPGARLVAPWTKLWRRTLEGAGYVRGVKLRAGALRAVVPRPAHAFADRIVPLRTLVGDVAKLELDAEARDPHRAPSATPTRRTWRATSSPSRARARATSQSRFETPTRASRAALSSSRRTRRR